MESLNIPVVVLCMMIIAYFGMKWMNSTLNEVADLHEFMVNFMLDFGGF